MLSELQKKALSQVVSNYLHLRSTNLAGCTLVLNPIVLIIK